MGRKARSTKAEVLTPATRKMTCALSTTFGVRSTKAEVLTPATLSDLKLVLIC